MSGPPYHGAPRAASTGCRKSNPTAGLPGNASRSGERECPSGRDPETHRVSPAPAGQCHPDPGHPHHKRQAPAGGGAGAGQGSAWRCGRGDGPCHRSGVGGWDSDLPPPVRAGSGNACVSPARAERCHQDPCHPHQQRPAPDPAGAGLCCAWTCRSTGNRLARAGKRMRFLIPPGGAVALTMPRCPSTLAGAIAPATAPR
jgi:hypothetical protein